MLQDKPKGDYYRRKSFAADDLHFWVQDANRPSWTSFIRSMSRKYGFGKSLMASMLKDNFPSVKIEGDKLVVRNEQQAQ